MRKFIPLLISAVILSACGQSHSHSDKGAAASVPIIDGAFEAKSTITEHMGSPAMLVFSETREWRHNEGIAGAGKVLVELGEDMGYSVFSTEHSALFNADDLSRFKLVIMNNMTGAALSAEQQSALQAWFADGGAIVAIHGAGDSSHEDWPWYADKVIGPRFTSHPADPQFQTARVETLAVDHPVMAGVPNVWEHNEEWYSFDSTAQDHGMTPLAGLDETSYSPRNDVYGDYSDLRMDLDGQGAIAHPVIWSKCHGGPEGSRSVYTALGHQVSVYDKGTSAGIPRLILANALNWAVKNSDPEGKGCAPLSGE